MDYYFVTVAHDGGEQPSTLSKSDLGGVDPGCLGLGKTSGFVSLAQLSAGVAMQVTAGPGREIKVFGVQGVSSLTSRGCDFRVEVPAVFLNFEGGGARYDAGP